MSEQQHTQDTGDVRAGIVTMAPFVVAFAPFALVLGSIVAQVDDPVAGWSGSWLIYGGSAHVAALQVGKTGALLAIVTGLLVNTRLLVYSSSLATRWQHQPRWFRLVAAALIIDPTWAVAEEHANSGASDAAHRRFFLAAGLTLGVGWSTAMAVGVLAANRLPTEGLDLAVPLCLIALLGSRLRDPAHRWAAVTAASVAIVLQHAPAGLGVLLGIGAGSFAAVAAGTDRSQR